MMQKRPFARWSLVAALIVAGTGCELGSRSYELRGQVLGVDNARGEVLIRHDQVPGLMGAMTMPFRVQRRKLLEGRRAGDLVKAQLVVRGADAYLASLESVGFAPAETEASAASSVSAPALLKPGESIPAQRFVDQNGRPQTLSTWHGRALAVTFTYTRCPIPTFCPLMDRQFAAIQRSARANSSLRDRVHLVSITFDPEHDTPAVLKEHAKRLDADPAVWTFLTGEPDEIDRWSARFGVTVSREGKDGDDIIHNLRTAIFDKAGRLVKIYNGTDWTPQQVLGDLETIVAGS